MLKITKPSKDRVDIELSGAVNAEDMRTALNDLIEMTEDIQNGRMLYKIADLAFPTLGAFEVKMGYLPKLFGLLSKIDRCAVLSDAAWIRSAAEIEGFVFPGIDIKGFAMHEAAEAEAWLTEDTLSVPV